jgi:hypothetical protein
MFIVFFKKDKPMKHLFFKTTLATLAVLAVLIPGCSRAGSALNGSGVIVVQELKAAEFNSINIKGAFEVEVSQAESYKVVLSTDSNLLSRIRVSLEHKTLKLSIEAPATFFPTSLKIKIALPEMVGLNLSEGAKAIITNYHLSDHFSLFLAGDSTLNGAFEADQIAFNLSDASSVSLSGTATYLDLDCKGGSKVDLGNLALTAAQIRLREGSEATLNVVGRFDATLNDASKVYYLGNPLFTDISVSDGSTMIHK